MLRGARPLSERYPGVERFTVRLYDMFDGWIDIKTDVTAEEAQSLWDEKTKGGTEKAKYADGDYYDIFPADTHMLHTPEFRGR